ncbi:dihydrodipicolinate reductase C-terminal domain-containing protein [Bdellovibrionota bacterium FG-2]
MIKLGLLGASGRMGQKVEGLIEKSYSDRFKISAAPQEGADLTPLLGCDVVIDFTSPQAVLGLVKLGENSSKLPVFVLGSTGWTPEQQRELEPLFEKTLVVQSSNFSLGVLAFQHILKNAAPLLNRLGYVPSIVETHHIHKKDAPSGTAISLQKILNPNTPAAIPTQSIREGEVIGDHLITFQGSEDRIQMGHFAADRAIFARGAIEVALWLTGKRTANLEASGRVAIEEFLKV